MRIFKTSFALLIFVPAVSAQNYNIDRYVIASGGGHSESATYMVDATIGQALVGNSSSDNYSMDAGFWAGGGGAQGSPCGSYVVGDYNGSDFFNVADIVAAFSFLKTGSPAPFFTCECPPGSGNVWAVAADVNNSCTFNVADVVSGFSFLKTGAPELFPCDQCPPGSPSPRGPGDGDQPLVVPRLKAKSATGAVSR